ncbi:MAG: alpha/beta hydrolase [Acidimicrobiales bacterium]|nr:alpha/beta hydrolase [Acidimicrobiales bacterium]
MPTVSANGLEFAYLEAGPADGPLALCLHGFPDAAPTWNVLLAELGDAGFHAVAPWLRGYAPTSVPADGVYQTGALVADANALHEALGGGSDAVIIGHDWGAIATYGIAVSAPEKWRRVVTMAVPPAAALGMGFLSYKQLQRSWYMFFFQHALSDMAVAMNDLEFIDGLWADWSPGYDGAAHVSHVKDALRDPANLAAALGYYRAMLGDGPKDPALEDLQNAASGVPTQPVLYLHGRNDGCLGVDLTTNAAMFLSPESRVEVLDDCGHFLQVERPAEVNKLVLDWVLPQP